MLIRYFKELFQDKKLMRDVTTIAIPIMFQSLIISAVNLVDNLMVGQLGDVAISGVATANKYYNVITFIIYSVIASCIIFLSQFNGAENHEKMKETFRFTIVFTYIILIIGFVVVMLFPSQLIKFIINDEAIIDAGTRYFRYAAFSYLPMGFSYVVASSMRAVGETKIPMKISVSSVIVNCILDYGLILGKFGLPRLEIEGAAIATIIARIIEMLLCFYALNKGDYVFNTKLKDVFKFDFSLVKSIMIKAWPLVLNEVAWNLGMVTLMKCYSSRGAAVNAAYSIEITVSDLFFSLFSGMATASSVLIGTPLGANKLEEARGNGYKLICFSLFMSLFFGLGLFLSSYIVGVIYKNVSNDVVSFAASFLRCQGLLYWIYMFNTQCYFILRSGGATKSTMLIDCGYMWICNIPLVAILSYLTSIPVLLVYVIGQLTDIGKGIFAFSIVKKEKWVKNLAIENE